jgi:D-serine dehydratase
VKKINEHFVDYPTKGIPLDAANRRLNVLSDNLPFPVLLLKESVLAGNIQKMATWCKTHGYLLAPHIKTTMCPQIFQRQIQAGAWAITVATVAQARVAAHFGVRRILMANQLVGKTNIELLVHEINSKADLELYCLVDSIAGVRHLVEHLESFSPDRPLNVLLEWGKVGWRSGVTTIEQAKVLLCEIQKHKSHLRFCGFEGYEGMADVAENHAAEISSIRGYLKELIEMAETLGDSCILSVGGSGYLDLIHESLNGLTDRFQIVIRSGSYITHDHGFYREKLSEARQRGSDENRLPLPEPALELWSLVQSLLDEDKALLTFGKRDCPYDLGMPIALYYVPAGQPLEKRQLFDNAKVTDLNDQHAFLSFDPKQLLGIGDRVVCGISHPCTAFDKWPVIALVDDDYQVIDWYRTFF